MGETIKPRNFFVDRYLSKHFFGYVPLFVFVCVVCLLQVKKKLREDTKRKEKRNPA